MPQWEYKSIDCEFRDGTWLAQPTKDLSNTEPMALATLLQSLGKYGWELVQLPFVTPGDNPTVSQCVLKRVRLLLPPWMPTDEETKRLLLEAPSAVVEILRDLSAESFSRSEALALITRLTKYRSNPAAALIILASTKHPAPEVQTKAGLFLAEAGDDRAVPVLVETLQRSSDLDELEPVSVALGKLGTSSARSEFVSLILAGEQTVRNMVHMTEGFGIGGGKNVETELTTIQSNTQHEDVRWAAMRKLVDIESREASPALLAAFRSGLSTRDLRYVVQSLAKLGRPDDREEFCNLVTGHTPSSLQFWQRTAGVEVYGASGEAGVEADLVRVSQEASEAAIITAARDALRELQAPRGNPYSVTQAPDRR